ncbi:MAG: STAS domain-containing protein [Leptospiraceae bacterium]|nr:STAS domain-containing protein [Leptospiraceae bacterium]MDW7975451.1 STAS domain-containing protein [Leptospiraceae bacterium]
MLKRKKVGNTVIVYPEGRLDVTKSTELEENVSKIIDEEGVRNIIMNLENVEYMSSSGFRVSISLLRKLKTLNGNLRLCNIRPSVKRIFDVIELTSLFEIYENEDEALKGLN